MKEKKSKEELRQSPGQFYYETIGMISLIFAIVILLKLGRVGIFLTILLKVLFGDWYLLFVVMILVFGCYLIFNHHAFNFKNQRFLGYFICTIGFLMLTHFSVHDYIVKLEGNYFSNTWLHYKNFIKSNNDVYLGGGLIGSVLFYLFYSLFGKVGVVLVSLIIILLGFTMIIDKPIIDIGSYFLQKFKKVKNYKNSFNNFFKYEIRNKENLPINIYSTNKKITLKHFDDYKNINYHLSQEKYLEETKGLICTIFNNMNIKYKINQSFFSYSCSFLSFHIYDEVECSDLGLKLSNIIEESIYLSKINNILNLEINNKFNSILCLKDVLTKQAFIYNNYLMPIGINIKNQLEEIDFSKEANILIIGDFNVGIKTFIASIIITTIMKVTTENFEFNLFDDIGEFNDYSFLFNNIKNDDIKEFLKNILLQIDERINTFSLRNVHQIDEYNILLKQENKKSYKRIVYIIELDDYNINYDYQYIDDKILYIIQVGRDVGVYVMFISRNIKKVSNILFSLFKYKCIFNCGKMESNVIESKHCKVLTQKGECLFYRENNEKRIQIPKFTKEELDKIKKYMK